MAVPSTLCQALTPPFEVRSGKEQVPGVKLQGVRIGTAEIYRQVETVPEILDSLVIGQDWLKRCSV